MLIIASTHIGNIADTPSRSLHWVTNADFLMFEEDRPARQILKAAGVHREYFKYNENQPIPSEIREALQSGKSVLYMSDQGCVNLADPGKELLQFAYINQIPLKIIPGPSSVTAALSACPFPTQPFLFHGFLAKKSEQRLKELANLSQYPHAIVLMDTPYRLGNLTSELAKVLGKKRKALLALDITGEAEDFIFGDCIYLEQCAKKLTEKLNFVIVLAPL